MVPSTDASKQNAGEATFLLMWYQCHSMLWVVQRNDKELPGMRIAPFEPLHMFHDRDWVCGEG